MNLPSMAMIMTLIMALGMVRVVFAVPGGHGLAACRQEQAERHAGERDARLDPGVGADDAGDDRAVAVAVVQRVVVVQDVVATAGEPVVGAQEPVLVDAGVDLGVDREARAAPPRSRRRAAAASRATP